MPHAIRMHQNGGPEVLQWEEVEVGEPKAGEVLLRHTAVGLNFIDTYIRSGLYPSTMPLVLGQEAAGVIEAVGDGVTGLYKGNRVAYAGPMGAYSERRLIAADKVVKLPDGVSDEQAAAMMLKGMTAQYLVRRIFQPKEGDTVLIHSAAGGVGLILCQWAKFLGATVIGTVGSEDKAILAKAHGCDHTILYRTEDVAARVREITGGAGVPVVYDSAGKDTFEGSLNSLRPRGLMISYGNSSGAVPPFSLGLLSTKGSLFLTRPTLGHYTATREELVATAEDLFGMVERGLIKINVHQTYPLRDAAQAHRDLESRKTTGSTVLLP